MRKWKWIGHTLRKDQKNITRHGLDWNGMHRENKGRVDQELPGRKLLAELQERNVSWKEAKQMAKNRVWLQKICDGPVFHLGTTGDDDDDIRLHINNFLYSMWPRKNIKKASSCFYRKELKSCKGRQI
jgi:hypothetical protein